MLNCDAGSRLRAIALVATCVVALAGCGKARVGTEGMSDDAWAKSPLVTCDLRCDWTSEGLIANLSFKNVTDSDLKLLNRNLLVGDEANELTWSPFEVTRRGARVPYSGKAEKRAAPTAADYRVLAPGEVVNATVNVGSAYDLSAPGAYRIRYASVNFVPETRKRIDIASNTVEVAKPGSP
jgi:hypothetical protein